MFLAGYGGMVSLMQMTVAGVAGYMIAVFGASGNANISLGWPWWLADADGDRASPSLSARSPARSRCAPRASTRS